jgi:hypothetical protein
VRRDLLAWHRGRLYLGAVTLAWAACARPGRLEPPGTFAPSSRESLEAVAARTTPAAREIWRIRWRSDDGRITLAGQGAVRVAPPDSLRVDLAVRLGMGRATMILAGDRVAAEPRDLVEHALPDRFALWAALGVLRVPDGTRAVSRLDQTGRALWRAEDGNGRATTFELRGDTLVGVTREVDGRMVARLELWRGPDGRVRRARVSDLAHGARFEVDVTNREAAESFPHDIWRLRP